MKQLTMDADYLICALYHEYLDRRANGTDKASAKHFGSSESIHEKLMPEWLFEDVDETCRELHRAKMVDCRYGDNVALHLVIADEGIIYMENRFGPKIETVLEFMTKLKSAIPFI